MCQAVIQCLVGSINKNDFHLSLRRLGLSTDHPDLEKRITFVLRLLLDDKIVNISSLTPKHPTIIIRGAIEDWVCEWFPQTTQVKKRILIGAEALYDWAVSQYPELKYQILKKDFIFQMKDWMGHSNRRMRGADRYWAGFDPGWVIDVTTVLEELEQDSRTWTSLFSKIVHVTQQYGEPPNTDKPEKQQLLVTALNSAIDNIGVGHPAITNVQQGLQQFVDYTQQDSPQLRPHGLATNFLKNRLCYWGALFRDEVLSCLIINKITFPDVIIAMLLEPLPGPTKKTGFWKFKEVEGLLYQLVKQKVIIVTPIWEQVRINVKVDCRDSFKLLWNNLAQQENKKETSS